MSTIKNLFGRETFMRVTLPALLILTLVIIALMSFQKPAQNKSITQAEAKTRAENFVNNYLMQSGTVASIRSISEEYDLYKLQIDIVSDVVESYLSKDGKLFFPQALNIDEISGSGANAPAAGGAPVATVGTKSDQPSVELFVMSHCPYGTQMEKGILPVLDALGNKIDFELKFVDYAMHGEKELKEQLNQYCIQKNEPDKFNAYLKCFVQSDNFDSCASSVNINRTSLSSCVDQTDREYKVMENFRNQVGYQGSFPGFDVHKADNLKYGVAGSPTLVINGQEVSSPRDPASLLRVICSAFNEEPSECSLILPSESPAPGFGSGNVSAGLDQNACAPVMF